MRAAYQAGLYREALRLLRPFWPLTLFATLMGAAGGLATSWLLNVINRSLRGADGPGWRDGLAFIGLCALALAGSAGAGIGNSVVGQRIVAALRKDIAARILCAPIAALERIRADRLMTTLNQDIDVFSVFTFNFSGYATAFAVMAGCIATMLYLSPILFLVAAVAIIGGMGLSRYARGEWLRYYQGVSTAQDQLQAQYRAITDGAKELRLNRARRQTVFGTALSGATDRIADYKIAAMRLHWLADTGSSTLFFLAIGAMVVLRSYLGVDTASITGFVITMLYVKGPIAQVAGGLPQLVQAQVAFRRIAALMTELANPEPSLLSRPPVPPGQQVEMIELRSVRYDFGTAFQLGPIDLCLRRGETVFIVGENGSGKTTLIKLLLGLYPPSAGSVLLNGQPVMPEGMDAYRQLFSAVFADYFLFEDLPAGTGDVSAQAAAYLERLEIAHAVQVAGGSFSTTALSTGQRKRLTLVHAYLEQRPVMMFDEWAADQDPSFRRVFYAELLPDLKRQGKTLIVVSHDDRYFGAADRIIRMEGGQIVEDRSVVR